MKFFLLLWALLSARVLGAGHIADFCTDVCEKTLRDADCTGFKVRNEDNWDEFSVLVNGTLCERAEDALDFNSNFLCCSDNEDECCKDYPGGFYVGFIIGVAGIAAMVLYAMYLCFGPKSKPAPEA